MQKITEKHNRLGSVEFFEDLKRKFFYARPHGIINPSLLREDTHQARAFAKRCNAPWVYITNAEDVYLVNPLNLLYLKEIKKIDHLARIVVFAPGWINYLLIQGASFLVKPDLVINDRKEFKKFISDYDVKYELDSVTAH